MASSVLQDVVDWLACIAAGYVWREVFILIILYLRECAWCVNTYETTTQRLISISGLFYTCVRIAWRHLATNRVLNDVVDCLPL